MLGCITALQGCHNLPFDTICSSCLPGFSLPSCAEPYVTTHLPKT